MTFLQINIVNNQDRKLRVQPYDYHDRKFDDVGTL